MRCSLHGYPPALRDRRRREAVEPEHRPRLVVDKVVTTGAREKILHALARVVRITTLAADVTADTVRVPVLVGVEVEDEVDVALGPGDLVGGDEVVDGSDGEVDVVSGLGVAHTCIDVDALEDGVI